MLYQGDDENKDTCKRCHTSRWNERVVGKKKKQLAKFLHYFPLKQQLQRLFMSTKTVKHMQWHATGNCNDGLMRHTRHFEAQKKFDDNHPKCASDP